MAGNTKSINLPGEPFCGSAPCLAHTVLIYPHWEDVLGVFTCTEPLVRGFVRQENWKGFTQLFLAQWLTWLAFTVTITTRTPKVPVGCTESTIFVLLAAGEGCPFSPQVLRTDPWKGMVSVWPVPSGSVLHCTEAFTVSVTVSHWLNERTLHL